MRVCVAGLGIIGGSICMSLKRAGYSVDGWNRSKDTLQYCVDNHIIDGKAEDFSVYDVVIIALPPEATMDFINKAAFKDGAVVADACGIKGWMEEHVYARERNFRYVGCHPMAGKETSGIKSACETLFDGASIVVVQAPQTDPDAYETIIRMARDMRFRLAVKCSAEVHDRKIAYTSQLCHIISNCYVKNDEIENCLGFTGGSFRDMTRISRVSPGMWTALYMRNRETLVGDIDNLVENLVKVRDAIASGDEKELEEVLAGGVERSRMATEVKTSPEIEIINLQDEAK
ncbi:MAG: prephenate dehydrogenase/arogenate dehydrogenase family protein [Clostridia bacterium]|nr:prephenate dehydrogenase/arogenate dehydrogenase family protein [Clostridia bacterium]